MFESTLWNPRTVKEPEACFAANKGQESQEGFSITQELLPHRALLGSDPYSLPTPHSSLF